MEEWRDIEGYEGLYKISNIGRVRSLPRNTTKGKILKPVKQPNGYLQVLLYKNGKKKKFLIHRLVAKAFIPNPLNLPEVNHKDENKENNRVDGCVNNLEWCSAKYNVNYGTRNKRLAEKQSKPVIQYDLQGNFIKEWSSGWEVQRQLGYFQGGISACCLGKQKTAYNFIWKYC